MVYGHLALVVAALFTGAAAYIHWAEHPARLALEPEAMVRQWRIAYRRGRAMQASLALAGFALGAAAWWTSGGALFALGALAMLANWPWTLLAMRRVNAALAAGGGADPRGLLVRWNRLHGARTAFGALAVSFFLLALAAIGRAAP